MHALTLTVMEVVFESLREGTMKMFEGGKTSVEPAVMGRFPPPCSHHHYAFCSPAFPSMKFNPPISRSSYGCLGLLCATGLLETTLSVFSLASVSDFFRQNLLPPPVVVLPDSMV